ncbi:IS110 family transposase [Patescibacteria group bacterium]|nr:IS110 family transposase [Patescibacteria group bacterium]
MNAKQNAHMSVGIDVAKEKVDVAIRFTNGEYEHSLFDNTSEEEIQKLSKWLSEHGISKDTPIVIESTGSYHWLCCIALAEQKFKVHLINPLMTKNYERASIRGSKTDKIDAKRLADIGTIETNLPLFFDSRESLSQKRYLSLIRKLEKTKQQLKRAFDDAVYASESIGVELQVDCISIALKQLEESMNVLKKIITDDASDMAKELATIPGVSLFQATAICTAVSGRTFETKDQLVAFFGLDIRARQSGQWTGREKISKRGNAYYRQILFQLGWSLQRNNDTFHEYYERMYKEQGKHYYTAILATARKFLRYFHAYYLVPCQAD